MKKSTMNTNQLTTTYGTFSYDFASIKKKLSKEVNYKSLKDQALESAAHEIADSAKYVPVIGTIAQGTVNILFGTNSSNKTATQTSNQNYSTDNDCEVSTEPLVKR